MEVTYIDFRTKSWYNIIIIKVKGNNSKNEKGRKKK